MGSQWPFVHCDWLPQAFPHRAQFVLVPSCVSQPAVAGPEQWANPLLQAATAQLPLVHVALALAIVHLVLQPPQ